MAQVYRWVDKDGKVHYSSQKPADAPAEALAIKSANSLEGNEARDPAAAPTTAAAPATAAGDPKTAMQSQVEALNKQRCDTAKAIAKSYDGAPWLEKSNADGTKTRLAPEDEAAERARIKNDVTSACGAGG
jgi:hypothetical protein